MPIPPAGALDRLEKRLEDLPMLPDVVHRLMSLRQDSYDYFDQVAQALHADPGFATRLLQYANSAALGAGRPITSIQEAMLRVGARGAVDLVLAHSAARIFVPGNEWEKTLWKHSIDVAWLMRKLSVLAVDHRGEPDEAYVFGLLHDIGRFVLYLEAPEELRSVEETDWATPEELIEAEIRICGFTHSELGYLALRKWRLPDALAEAVRWHHTQPLPLDKIDGRYRALNELLQEADWIAVAAERAEAGDGKARSELRGALDGRLRLRGTADNLEFTIQEALRESRRMLAALHLQ
ncbi:MAG: HDOD domain-containing protein [Betaproteobacteria bacterium]|nr:HDOD domain-containing protein [Betaproteobacteria bacterium]